MHICEYPNCFSAWLYLPAKDRRDMHSRQLLPIISFPKNILLALVKVTKSTQKLWLMWVTLETLASINIQKRQKASHFCYLEQCNQILPCWRLLNSFVLTVCFGYYSNIYMHFEGVNITNRWSRHKAGSKLKSCKNRTHLKLNHI